MNYVKSKEKFLAENYPEVKSGKGQHIHPDMFLAHTTARPGFYDLLEESDKEHKSHFGKAKGDIFEKKAFNFIIKEFENEDCFIYSQ